MKKIVLISMALCISLSGCMDEVTSGEAMSPSNSHDPLQGIIARASNGETATGSTTMGDVEEPVVFTANDMEWFNETTQEVRFKNNRSMQARLTTVKVIKFYLNDEYLFPSVVNVNSSNIQVNDSLVFYYNKTENKFFFSGGFSPEYSLSSPGDIIQNILSEWNKFLDELKKEQKYRK